MKQIDILNLEWPRSDRDLHIVTPVLVYLHKKYHLSYMTKSIFNGYYYLVKYRPKLLIISNFVGADINHEITKLAYSMGVKVVTFISEGNVKPENIDQFLWGWNKDKKLYTDRTLLWSRRSEKLFTERYPDLRHKLVTTGGTGFDRYRLLDFISKETFLQENSFKYKKIIGIAAWGFDHLFGKYYEKHKKTYLNVFGQEQIDMHRNDLIKIQNIYKKLIEDNPDILFILRYHPGTVDFEKNEFYTLNSYQNVFISNQHENHHYKISDLINVSDLWIGYETTTAMEAWLLDKQTFLINPTRSDFVRENVHKGSPVVKTAEEAQGFINTYFSDGSIKAFMTLRPQRDQIIKDVIEYGDGKNYIRASEEIIKVFNEPQKQVVYSPVLYKKAFIQVIKLLLAKTIAKKKWPHLNIDSDFADAYKELYQKAIDV